MSTPKLPRNGLPRTISDGEMLSFAVFNRWLPGASLRGGFFFRENRAFATQYFPNIRRTIFLRNPGPTMIPRRGYRVVWYPARQTLSLLDYSADFTRGIVLQFATMSHRMPPNGTVARIERRVSSEWCTDLILCGIDRSKQVWAHHIPVRLANRGIEAGERWLFGLQKDDVLAREL
ncbi:MAG: hypothetical protein OK452_09090 [Thaumarchaeota archaeon]|nr:hypothetical protein [Nitrososphaerota archaeon]